MSDQGPWGIIVTGTLHLPALTRSGGKLWRPACGNSRVRQIMDDQRRLWRIGRGKLPNPTGFAEGRPVCVSCKRAYRRHIELIQLDLDEVAEYERGLR